MRNEQADASRNACRMTAASKHETRYTAVIEMLEGLLSDSIRLRDLYKNARHGAAAHQDPELRRLLDEHYHEQLRLVDVLIDRVRLLGGDRVFARDLLPGREGLDVLRGRLG